MLKTVKPLDIFNLYKIINSAKFGKVSDEDKIKIWKFVRLIKPIALKLEEDYKDIRDKFKPEDYETRLMKAQNFEIATREGRECDFITKDEYDQFLQEYKNFEKLTSDAMDKVANKEMEIEFEPISEESFEKFILSNDWNMD